MKICIAYAGDVSQPTGGTDRVTALASGLAERDHTISLVVPEPDGVLPARLDSVSVRTVNPTVDNGLGRALAVARTATDLADSETCLQFEHSLLGGIGGILGDTTPILDMHDLAYARYDHVQAPHSPVAKRVLSAIEKYAIERAEHVIAVSEYMRDFLIERWGVSTGDVTVIPNGYFPEVIDEVRETPIVDGRVCFLGTLHPKVDAEALCRIAELAEVDEVIVIGDGAQRDHLERLARTHDALEVTGRLPDGEAFELVASAELVVNPQQSSELQRSSSPVKLFYYAALGKPIVTTRGPSVVDRLVEHDAARAPETREGFIDDVTEIMEDTQLRTELGTNAKQLAQSFRWSERANSIDGLYQSFTKRT